MDTPNGIWSWRIKSLMTERILIKLLENDLVTALLLIPTRALVLIHIPSLIRYGELLRNLSRFLIQAV